jgi:myo-inositol-1-phosphate synthase
VGFGKWCGDDIQAFKQRNNLSRLVMIWCGSTEIFMPPNDPAYSSLESFEKALRANN